MSVVIGRWSVARKKTQGFTLIELMVAISIVAIVSTVGLVVYGQAQVTARDSRRKQDLQSIQLALELYKQVNNAYPGTTTPLKPTYIATIPTDPKPGYSYTYVVNSAATCTISGVTFPVNQYYYISAKLESATDPQRNGSTPQYKTCGDTPISGADTYIVSNSL